MQILNLDPSCQKIEKDRLAKKTLFLDTNFIIGLLCESEIDHEACVKIVEITKKAGSTLTYTSRTKKEFLDKLEAAKNEYRMARYSKKPFRKHANIFIRDYLVCKQRRPGLNWGAYLYRMKKMEKLLKNEYGILMDEKDYDYIEELENFDEVVSLVRKYSTKFQHGLLLREKEIHTAQHDAYHILLMRNFQKEDKPDIFGANKYFLTYDKTLLFVDRELGLDDFFPSTMLGEVWGQMLSVVIFVPNLTDQKTADVFGKLITSHFFSIGSYVDPREELIRRIMNSIDPRGLDDEDIKSILAHKLINDYLDKACEDIEKGIEPPDPTPIVKKVEEEKNKEKIEKLSKKLEQQREEVSKFEHKTKILEEEIKKRKITERKILKKHIKEYINKIESNLDGILERFGDLTIIKRANKFKENYQKIDSFSDDEAIKAYTELENEV